MPADEYESLWLPRQIDPPLGFPPPKYRFGDVTRMVARWLGPHARAVAGELDWLKFGKALALALMAGQTVDLGVAASALLGAIRDPQLAAAIPPVATAVVYLVEQVRRVRQGARAA